MPKTPSEFEKKYPAIIDFAFDFSDPPPSHKSDEETARKIRSDWPDADRIKIFNRLLVDSDRLLRSLDSDWRSLGIFTSRRFQNVDDARSWLLNVQGSWRKELARLEGI